MAHIDVIDAMPFYVHIVIIAFPWCFCHLNNILGICVCLAWNISDMKSIFVQVQLGATIKVNVFHVGNCYVMHNTLNFHRFGKICWMLWSLSILCSPMVALYDVVMPFLCWLAKPRLLTKKIYIQIRCRRLNRIMEASRILILPHLRI